MSELQMFKEKEKQFRSRLEQNGIYAVRMDGKAFHTFTKQYKAPYDEKFMATMDAAAQTVIDQVFPDALLAYVQSDEITVIFTDKTGLNKQLPFGGRVEKILTVSSAAATAGFIMNAGEMLGVPLFDARLTKLDDLSEVLAYLHWRRLDARKNAVTMAAGALFSPSQLKGVSTRDRMALLAGTEYEKLPEGFFNGRLIVRETYLAMKTFTHKATGQESKAEALCSRFVTVPATQDRTEYETAKLLNRIVR